MVHRAWKAGEILRLKPGFFVLSQPYRKSEGLKGDVNNAG